MNELIKKLEKREAHLLDNRVRIKHFVRMAKLKEVRIILKWANEIKDKNNK